MNVVLYIASAKNTSCAQRKFRGAQQRFMQAKTLLRKIDLESCTASDLPELAEFWQASGIIIDCAGQRPKLLPHLLSELPVVYLDLPCGFSIPGTRSVVYDIRATCQMAARELLCLNCVTYGYVGYGRRSRWSEERKRIFLQAMKLNGCAIRTFDLAPNDPSPSVFYQRLSAWLSGLPKPAGLFVADDAYALHLHAALQNLKLQIPSDVAILSVDDESDLLVTPGISSIQLDFPKAGSLAAELLLESPHSRTLPNPIRYFGPIQLLRRQSTRKFPTSGGTMAEIIRRIHQEAPHGLTAAEVASWMNGSRRLAEIRFREATKHSILDEITIARIDRAKELLAMTDHQIKTIVDLCGYRTENAFGAAFKSATGLSPSAWRKTKGTDSGHKPRSRRN